MVALIMVVALIMFVALITVVVPIRNWGHGVVGAYGIRPISANAVRYK